MKKASIKPLPVGYPVYRAISQLNRSFEDCVENLNHVMSFKLFNADHLRTYELMVEEARALANQEFGEVINDREFQNSAFFGRLRLKLQGEQTGTKERPASTESKRISTSRKGILLRNQRGKKVQR